jgi:hypothetical protein
MGKYHLEDPKKFLNVIRNLKKYKYDDKRIVAEFSTIRSMKKLKWEYLPKDYLWSLTRPQIFPETIMGLRSHSTTSFLGEESFFSFLGGCDRLAFTASSWCAAVVLQVDSALIPSPGPRLGCGLGTSPSLPTSCVSFTVTDLPQQLSALV